MSDLQQQLDQFFQSNDKGYPRDPRRMAYAKLRKNIAGMDEEQVEAFIDANLFISHSQYKMALANLIKLMNNRKQTNRLNEVRQLRKIAGLLKENDMQGAQQAEKVADKVEQSLEAKLDQLSPDQIQKLQADLAKMGITADTPVEDAAQKIEGSLDEAEGDDKKKLASALQSIGTGLIGSLLVPIIPLAVGQSTGLGTAAGLGITFAAGGLLVGLAKALQHKAKGQVKEDDYSIPDNARSGDTAKMGNVDEAGNIKGITIQIPGNSNALDFGKAAAREVIESFGPREYRSFLEAFLAEFKKLSSTGSGNINENDAAHVAYEVQKLVDNLLEKGKIGPKQAKMVMDYVKKHGESLYHDLGRPEQWFNAAADSTWRNKGHRLGTRPSE